MSESVENDGLPWEAELVRALTEARRASNLSQTELARRASLRGLSFHQQTVQRIESGERPLRVNEAVVLSQVLDLDLPQMLENSREGIHQLLGAQLSRLRDMAVEIEEKTGRFLEVQRAAKETLTRLGDEELTDRHLKQSGTAWLLGATPEDIVKVSRVRDGHRGGRRGKH